MCFRTIVIIACRELAVIEFAVTVSHSKAVAFNLAITDTAVGFDIDTFDGINAVLMNNILRLNGLTARYRDSAAISMSSYVKTAPLN